LRCQVKPDGGYGNVLKAVVAIGVNDAAGGKCSLTVVQEEGAKVR
jgi:hypothetical protein